MRNLTWLTAILLLSVFISGCNGDEENVTDVPENAPVENNQNDAGQTQNDAGQTEDVAFQFTSFDLDVDYSDNREFDVDYDNERDEMEAEIKDDLNNKNVKGDEAFSELQPIFEDFKFDKDTPDEEVISEVLKAFELGDDYQKFELEVKYLDGTEKEYDVTK